MGSFAEHARPSIQNSYCTDATLLCSCMGESKYQEARKFSIVCQSRYFRDKVLSEFKCYRSTTGHTSDRHCCSKHLSQISNEILQYHDHLRKRVVQQQNSFKFITSQRNIMKHFYNLKYFDLSDDHSYTESVSKSHSLLRWNTRWLFPDFTTHLKKSCT